MPQERLPKSHGSFNQAKCWIWWQIVMCGGSILSCFLRIPHEHKRFLKEEEDFSPFLLPHKARSLNFTDLVVNFLLIHFLFF